MQLQYNNREKQFMKTEKYLLGYLLLNNILYYWKKICKLTI